MKFYHGTSPLNKRSIEEDGFFGGDLSEMTDGFTTYLEGGVVYLASSILEAREYGDCVFQVHLEGVKHHVINDGNTTHYWVDADELNNQSWWEIVE